MAAPTVIDIEEKSMSVDREQVMCIPVFVPTIPMSNGGWNSQWHNPVEQKHSYDGYEHKQGATQRFPKGRFCRQPGTSALSRCMDPPNRPQVTSDEKIVGVKLSNLPKTLCSRSIFEVAIEQAGLQSKLKAFELGSDSAATAVLALEGEEAAQQCIKHFNGRQWAGSAIPLSARYCNDVMTLLSTATDHLENSSLAGEYDFQTDDAAEMALAKETPRSRHGRTESSSTASTDTPSTPSKVRWSDYDI
jgi:hypothetical protein